MHELIPGEWYLMFVCSSCKTRQVLFPDLSEGKSSIRASYVVSCAHCWQRDTYESEHIERYQHLEQVNNAQVNNASA
jgi:hypothetical protein